MALSWTQVMPLAVGGNSSKMRPLALGAGSAPSIRALRITGIASAAAPVKSFLREKRSCIALGSRDEPRTWCALRLPFRATNQPQAADPQSRSGRLYLDRRALLAELAGFAVHHRRIQCVRAGDEIDVTGLNNVCTAQRIQLIAIRAQWQIAAEALNNLPAFILEERQQRQMRSEAMVRLVLGKRDVLHGNFDHQSKLQFAALLAEAEHGRAERKRLRQRRGVQHVEQRRFVGEYQTLVGR